MQFDCTYLSVVHFLNTNVLIVQTLGFNLRVLSNDIVQANTYTSRCLHQVTKLEV